MQDHPSISIRLLRAGPWSGNPLMRPGDRVLGVLRVVAALACLVAVPLAGAVGTAVYGGHADRIRVEHATRTHVEATIVEDPHRVRAARGGTEATVRWEHDGRTGTAVVAVPASASRGARVTVWLDPSGTPTDPPIWSGAAVMAGIAAGAAVLAATALSGAGLCAAVQGALLRHHTRRLDSEWRQFSPGHL
ncbi:Rv1733c family protein [Nocardia wallacei]|uniref:Uncharacterized protein n=1 Tax=Nocardia wallacei TaxID=480035 RepID=A0A7G1KUZ3_9NOCA|nr:hypothetical protein [Nocardia wallacei]BCK57789.1 hypothetical protein NWFMUON74_55610 [Nocardia wallacei]